MVDRAEIHTAAGIAAAQLGVAPREALAALRARSYRTNTALPDLARQVMRLANYP